jgi:hypothetical protein
MATSGLIPVQVGDAKIDIEVIQVAGTQATSGTDRATRNVTEAFARAQDTIAEVARTTAEMIGEAGKAARPDRVEVEFGLRFSASGGVIMVGVAGEATLKVTLEYNTSAHPPVSPDAVVSPALASAEAASSGPGELS